MPLETFEMLTKIVASLVSCSSTILPLTSKTDIVLKTLEPVSMVNKPIFGFGYAAKPAVFPGEVIPVQASTTRVKLAVLLQALGSVKLYEAVKVPEAVGVKTEPFVSVPLYIPPEGDPVRLIAFSLTHTVFDEAVNDTEGSAFTVTVEITGADVQPSGENPIIE